MKTIETLPGDHISKVAAKAVELVASGEREVSFDFNEVVLTARPGMSAADLVAEYGRICEERRAAYVASPEYKARQREAEEREQRRTTALAAALAKAPTAMSVRDTARWQEWRDNNKDGYGAACVSYAERWARVMEGMISSGATLAGCAEEASHLADTEGITGFMYGAAVSMLAQCWTRGEELRRWHNEETQIGDEGDRANETGGVLNPALLTVR